MNLVKKTVIAIYTTSAETQQSLTDFFPVIKQKDATKENKEGERNISK